MPQKWKGGKKEAQKRYRESHREKRREYNKQWYLANLEREREKRRKYTNQHRQYIYQQSADWQKRARRKYKILAIKAYGGICACCNEAQIAFLEIHHPNGDGKADRQKFSGNSLTFYQWLFKNNYPSGYEILCSNCHKALHGEGICPHQLRNIQ